MPPGTKGRGGLGGQTMPCSITQSCPPQVRCWPSHASHSRFTSFRRTLILPTQGRETGTLVWEAIRGWRAFGSGHLASRHMEVCCTVSRRRGHASRHTRVQYSLSSGRGAFPGAAVRRDDEHASNFILSLSGRGRRKSWPSETGPRDAGLQRKSSAENSSQVQKVFLSQSQCKTRRADPGVRSVV